MTFYRSVTGKILHTNVYLFKILGHQVVVRNWRLEIW